MLKGGASAPPPASSSSTQSAPNKGLALFDEMLLAALSTAEAQGTEFAANFPPPKKKPNTPPAPEVDLQAILNKWDASLRECAQMKKSYLMELSQVRNVADKLKYRACLESYDKRVERSAQDLKYQRNVLERSQLMPSNNNNNAVGRQSANGENAMLSETRQIQDKTSASLARTKSRMAETVEIGQKTAQDLESQGDTIKRIHEGVIEVNDEISKANVILTSIMRRIATDKVVICFCFILVVLVVAVVVLFATGTIVPPDPKVPG